MAGPAGRGTSAPSTPATSSGKLRPSARAVGQVMTALKNSNSPDGPTMTDIVKFISSALHRPATKRQVITALKRSVEFGILKRKKGHYQISSPEEKIRLTKAVRKTAGGRRKFGGERPKNSRHRKLLGSRQPRKPRPAGLGRQTGNPRKTPASVPQSGGGGMAKEQPQSEPTCDHAACRVDSGSSVMTIFDQHKDCKVCTCTCPDCYDFA